MEAEERLHPLGYSPCLRPIDAVAILRTVHSRAAHRSGSGGQAPLGDCPGLVRPHPAPTACRDDRVRRPVLVRVAARCVVYVAVPTRCTRAAPVPGNVPSSAAPPVVDG
jgi:hypothetical protein